ncbi:MAG TPA: hypothetical protein VF316_03350 [Polyangiaceae bacterium]
MAYRAHLRGDDRDQDACRPAGPLAAVSVHVYPGKKQHADLKRLVDLVGGTFAGRPVLVGGDSGNGTYAIDVTR